MGDLDLVLFPHIWSHLANEVDIVFWSISLTLLLFPLPPRPAPPSSAGPSLQSTFSHRCPAQLINSSQQRSVVIPARGADGCPAGLGAHSFPAQGRHQPEPSPGGACGWEHRTAAQPCCFFCFLVFFLAFKLNKVCSAPQPHEAAWFAPAHVHCGTVRLARAGLHLLQMEVASPPAPHRSQHQMLPNTKLETHPLAITARE